MKTTHVIILDVSSGSVFVASKRPEEKTAQKTVERIAAEKGLLLGGLDWMFFDGTVRILP